MSSLGSITALAKQLMEGHAEAAGPLWKRYYQVLKARARKRLLGTVCAEADESDVVVNAFDSFCRAAEKGRFVSLQDREDLWKLLALITDRKAIDQVHRNRRRPTGGPEGLDKVPANDPPPDLAAQLAEGFQYILDRLTDPQLRQIALWKMEGCSHAEIATQLRCSVVTVDRRWRRIRQELRG
jgi:DNA-directed RNA polymerase specialized sigma24 family protein